MAWPQTCARIPGEGATPVIHPKGARPCQLRPIDLSEYGVSFTPAEQARLNAIFPTGVCDWSRPGVEQRPLQACLGACTSAAAAAGRTTRGKP